MSYLSTIQGIFGSALKGFWTLDETSGVYADTSGNAHDSVGIVGSPTRGVTALVNDGGKAYTGVASSGVNVAASTDFQSLSGDFAIGFYFKTSSAALQVVLGDNLGNFWVGINASKLSETGNAFGTNTYSDGATHFAVITRVGGLSNNISCYVDGATTAIGTLTSNSTFTIANRLGIGNLSGGSDATIGSFATIGTLDGIWFSKGTGVTGTQAQTIYNAGQAAAATSYTLTGPSSGTVNVASTNFTVTPNGAYTGTITPASTGSGTFSPTSLSYSSSTAAQTFTYTPTSTSGSPHTISVTSSPALTNPGSIAYTVVPVPITIAVTNTNLFFSPYNWYSDGSGTLQSNNIKPSSTYGVTNNTGAYIRLAVTSVSGGYIKLNLDTTPVNGVTASKTPILAWSVDGKALSTYQLVYSASAVQVSLATALTAGSHTLILYYQSTDLGSSLSMGDEWNDLTTGASAVKVTGFEIDGGSSIATPTLQTKRILSYGDSIEQGARVVSNGGTIADTDAVQAYGPYLAAALTGETGIIGFAGQGLSGTGAFGNVPKIIDTGTPANSAWRNYSSGRTRLDGSGLLQPAPDYIISTHGTNSSTQADFQSWLGVLRTAAPLAAIFICVPPGGYSRSNITAAIAAVGDSNAFLIDAGTDIQGYVAGGLYSYDLLHPNVRGHAQYSADLAVLIQKKLSAVSGSGGSRGMLTGGRL